MANTYHSLIFHFVFSTKQRRALINDEIEQRLWQFIGGIVKQNKMKALCVGGTVDHVHMLVSLPTTISVGKAVQLVKGGSSKWIHETFPRGKDFEWQEGYGAFTVSVSHVPDTITYIKNQREHHRKTTFKEEYLSFLKKHGIEYDERYVWG